MGEFDKGRRVFLRSAGGAFTTAWLTSNWPAIAAAAQHAHQLVAGSAAEGFKFLSVADAADVAAIAEQIVPSGATPGAREARAVVFIDRALSTFFRDWGPEFRDGLAEFQSGFGSRRSAPAAFARASASEQLAFLQGLDHSRFFETMRFLTVLGLLTSPAYGGNHGRVGWKLIGFEDKHVFEPPFGYYDREYAGFVPYPTKQP